jgi:hypothetical protein
MMSAPTPSIFETRRDQMFPTLEALEIESVRRFRARPSGIANRPVLSQAVLNCWEETSHVLQHIDFANAQSGRRVR